MQSITLILSSLILVTVLIWLLHKRQLKKSIENAEQANPLPPLDRQFANANPQQKIAVAQGLTGHTDDNRSWQVEVKMLRDQGHFEEALAQCKKQYPKIRAFQQTLITLRASLKSENGNQEETLRVLYRTAIVADWVRTAKSSADRETLIKLENLENPEIHWQSLGYKNLDLLTKTDCKILVNQWGEPNNHSNINKIIEYIK